MPDIKPCHDPYEIFRLSGTPFGLYARQKWLGEDGHNRWREDFERAVTSLRDGRSDNGLWNDSPVETIQRLFGLHLTVRQPDALIHGSLDRLLERVSSRAWIRNTETLKWDNGIDLPFVPGSIHEFVLPATLFSAGIFDRAYDPQVLHLYEEISAHISGDADFFQNSSAIHNFLRAFAVHPEYRDRKTTGAIVEWLRDRQNREGDWGPDIPFYQAVNALAHLRFSESDAQLEKAFRRLVRIQNEDGSWGNGKREANTFLAVHALRNKDLIE